MLSDFQILGSSSSGNCALLSTGQTKVLIDAGFSAKRICELLDQAGESIDSIDAVFLTHEHSDHAQGIRGLARRSELPVFANRDTADAVQAKLNKRANWQIFQTGTTFSFRDIEIRTFALPHDAYDPVGYRFHWGIEGDLFSPEQSLAWITDLGYIPQHVQEQICTVETLVIEANYDETLLDQDEKRPWSTKQRIRGRHGHLSNDAVFSFLGGLREIKNRLEKVYLAHLSRDCNTVELINERITQLEHNSRAFHITVVDPVNGTSPAVSPLPQIGT
ncbi:MAG: MBL fold metallo-hydrolase [Verrucomicrobiota bacterium]